MQCFLKQSGFIRYFKPDSNNWQPETFCYKDAATGKEVWRLTSTNGLKNIYHDSLGASPWSADGKRIAFSSTRDTNAYAKSPVTSGVWMVVDTDGSKMRNVVNGVKREYWAGKGPYWSWSPIEPDVSYDFSSSKHGQISTNYMLYRGEISDTADSRSAHLQFPGGKPLVILKSIGDDGKSLIAFAADETWLYPANLMTGSVGFSIYNTDFSEGFTTDRPHGANKAEKTYWKHTREYWPGNLHGFGYHGVLETAWFHIMPNESGGAFWKYDLLGSAPDGSGDYTHDTTYPYDWGGGGPLWCPGRFGEALDPWRVAETAGENVEWAGNPSHGVFDRWGTRAFFNATDKGTKPSLYDIIRHKFIGQWPAGYLHGTNRAWADIAVCSAGNSNNNFSNVKIKLLKNSDFNATTELCTPHTLYNNMGEYAGASYEYNSISRPSLSPDGTKVGYHSTFLNAKSGEYDNKPDIYYVVAYYPYPPELTECSVDSGTVNIQFDWQNTLSDPNPRTYTTRGWPDESVDDRPIPREIEKYRVWRSQDNSTWTPVGSVDAEHFSRFDFANGGFKSGQNNYWEITDTPGDGIWYYAVSSIEFSGLESRRLSNSWKIKITDGSVVNGEDEGTQETDYPADPGGDSNFWTTLPEAPLNLVATKLATPGHYQLSWDEPEDAHSIIRYYNIYYSSTGTPSAIQQNRIASVPVGTNSWLDWLADSSAENGYYKITSVDTQGNEGAGDENFYSDINNDGSINVIDITLCLNIIQGIANGNGDANNDGQTNVQDVYAIVDDILSK